MKLLYTLTNKNSKHLRFSVGAHAEKQKGYPKNRIGKIVRICGHDLLLKWDDGTCEWVEGDNFVAIRYIPDRQAHRDAYKAEKPRIDQN